MDQCPVCTLYLREGMSLGAHLDTHPKDQVIRALCSIAKGGRRGTPYDSGRSEASFRSRSRTPARDSRRRRRSARASPAPSGSYRSLESAEGSPEARFDADAFGVSRRTLEPARVVSTPSLHADSSYSESPTAGGAPPDPLERVYLVSRNSTEAEASAGGFVHRSDYLFCGERSGSDSTESGAPVAFAQPRPSACSSVKPPILVAAKEPDAPPALRYVTTNLNPVHFVLPASPSFVRGPAENIVVAVPSSDTSKLGGDPSAVFPRFAPLSALSFRRPGPAVPPVSQIVYQESAYVNGKQFLSTTPDPHETPLKPPPVYRNVMVFNPFSGSSCLYPQQSTDRRHMSPALVLDASPRTLTDPPVRTQTLPNSGDTLSNDKSFSSDSVELKIDQEMPAAEDIPESSSLFGNWGDDVDFGDASTKNSGVKILSNVKVELPVQSSGVDSARVKEGAEIDGDDATLPDFIDREICDSYDRSRFYRRGDFHAEDTRRTGEAEASVANTFSVIKNIGNPNLYRDGTGSGMQVLEEPRPLPDLTCNEKPSVSPCSDLTNDSVEVAYDRPVRRPGPASTLFSASSPVTRSSSRKNLFTKKPKKILRIKNKKDSKKPIPDSPNSGEKNPDRAGASSCRGPASGFFKDIDKIRKTSVSSTVTAESSSATGGTSFPPTPSADNAINFVIDKLEPPGDDESECPGRFAPTPTAGDDLLKAILEETAPPRENVDAPDLEMIRPVNVIAFGNMTVADSDSGGGPSKVTPEPIFMEKHSDDTGRDPYAEFFSVDRESFDTGDGVQKIEVCIVEEEVTKDGEYVWDETPQKEEFAFANFMREDYAHGMYGGPDGGGAGGPEGRRVSGHFSAEDVCGDDGDYAELLCPQDTFLERERKGSFLETVGPGRATDAEGGGPEEGAALNIRADERMPPRGELSEQDSSGDVDTPWAGMYHDVVGGSTSYDLIARETWPSDGSDVEMPVSPAKHAFETEDIPIVVGVKPPDKNYKCATCGKSFNCPKERRVHRSKEHPVAVAPGDPADVKKPVRKRRPSSVKTNIKIKSEKVVKNEGLSSLSNSKMDLTDEGVMNLKLVDGVLTPDLDAVDNKPKLELVKEEPKKRKREYTCVACKEEFFTDLSYHEHLKIHPLECLTCGKFFNRRANLQLHIKRHLGIKNFRCDVCDKRFITKQKMTEHHNIHVLCAPIKCNMCDDTFRRHSNMVQHRNRHHLRLKRRPRDHVCHCGEVFRSKKKLLWHKEVHDERPKACPHCSERFVHAASLTRHVRRAHNGCYVPDEKRKRENVQCPVCGNVYLKSSMDTHLRTHTGARPFSCVICSKGFSTKWNLKLHRWTHANRSSKPFKCALCKGAFVRRADYVSHMNAHRSVRPYTCNHCGCRFIRKYNCQRHVREHETAKRHACPVPDCGKTFHRGYYLSEHMRVHSGARPFSCNICGKASSTKSNHNKHLKIHHAKEPVARED